MKWLLTLVVSAFVFNCVSYLFNMVVKNTPLGFDLDLC